ncbi:OLC1v1035270C1 [Oldenlandia corymbosa var. corymbosa]|uniref:OLC1v1035270C1 n=1 Tax=Oldenlandia corymbosa var. corymbosa TaxID=529605 RepID=A0AAV1CSK0_OLDCO|nr:OLC1v1035270C1 [Oldenlandia corymbosa var. corymbosa]
MHETLVDRLMNPKEEQFPYLEILKQALSSVKFLKELSGLAGDVSDVMTNPPPAEFEIPDVLDDGCEEDSDEEEEDEKDLGDADKLAQKPDEVQGSGVNGQGATE